MRLPDSLFSVVVLMSLFIGMSGCFSSSKSGIALDGRENEESAPPFVDLFIEYPGPSDKWAGPPSLTAHLATGPGQSGSVKVLHPSFESSDPHSSVSVEQAREQVDRMNSVVNHDLKTVPVCTSPVRVRLVRADGALISKQGCRGQSGWPRVASDLTAQWISLSLVQQDQVGHKDDPSGKESTSQPVTFTGVTGAQVRPPASEVQHN